MNGNYEALCQYFEKADRWGGALSGYFTSQLSSIAPRIEQLVKREVIDLSKPFLDAGSGDGRIVILTAEIYGIASVGVDFSYESWSKAKKNIKTLRKQGILNEPNLKIIKGNFELDEPYKRNRINFEDFGTIYNFETNSWRIVRKIVNQSPSGTIFLLYNFNNDPRVKNHPGNISSLVLKESIELDNRSGGYLHVYRK